MAVKNGQITTNYCFKKYNIEWRQNGTSHVCFRFKSGVFPIPAKRPIKPIYIIEFLKRIEEEI